MAAKIPMPAMKMFAEITPALLVKDIAIGQPVIVLILLNVVLFEEVAMMAAYDAKF